MGGSGALCGPRALPLDPGRRQGPSAPPGCPVSWGRGLAYTQLYQCTISAGRQSTGSGIVYKEFSTAAQKTAGTQKPRIPFYMAYGARLSKKLQRYRRAAALRLPIRNQRRVRWFRNPCVARDSYHRLPPGEP